MAPIATPLLRLLRSMTPPQKKQLAAECNTTVVYLYQLAGSPHPNPTLRLAKALVDASRSKYWRKLTMCDPLTYDDLLVPGGSTDDLGPAGTDAG